MRTELESAWSRAVRERDQAAARRIAHLSLRRAGVRVAASEDNNTDDHDHDRSE